MTPANDKLDGTYMYAGKAATDGSNTYLFGWCPTKAGFTDNGSRDFGGNLIVHQLSQNDDGTLNVRAASSITKPFSQKQALNLVLKQESIGYDGNNVTFTANQADRFLVYDRLAGERMITGTISNIQAGAEFGFVFGMDKEVQNTNYYKINCSEANDMVAGMAVAGGGAQTDGKVNIALEPGKDYTFKIVIDGSVCVVYINDKVALTSRIYSLQNNLWGLFASKGGVEFKNVQSFGL
jgi:beta-fructofuranosidase